MRHQLIDPKVIEELNKTAVERMENEKKVRVLDRKVETSNKPV